MSDLRLACLLTGALVLLSSDASAQSWPSRPIRLVVPYAPGGSSDTLGRIIAQSLTETLGQKVYVENLPGAGGLLGVAQIARAEPDGYSLVVTSFASLVVAPVMNPNIEYDPIGGFSHIAYMGGTPNSFIINSSLGIRSLEELIAHARRTREPVLVGSAGHGSLGHLVAAFFGQKAGMPLEHVPYKGSGPVVADVAAGHLKLASISVATALGQIRANRVVPLAVSAQQRVAELPNVPTFKELGYPEIEVTSWFSISAPAGLPDEIVQRLNREVVRALQHPEMQKRLEQEGIELKPLDPRMFNEFVKSEIARWAPIAAKTLTKR